MITLLLYPDEPYRVMAKTPWANREQCRSVPGARWDKKQKSWHWPVSAIPVILREFKDVRYSGTPIGRLLARAHNVNRARELTLKVAQEQLQQGVQGIQWKSGINPYEHQWDGLQLALNEYGVQALFDQTGTGKTIEGLMWLRTVVQPINGMRLGYVVCPVTLIDAAWENDIKKHFPDLPFLNLRRFKKGAERAYAIKMKVKMGGCVVCLLNYEMLRTDPVVRDAMWGGAVVFDESSKLKNVKATITKEALNLAPALRAAIIMSGTPAPNTPEEYWPQMRMLSYIGGYDPFPGLLSEFRARWGYQRGARFGVNAVDVPDLVDRMRPIARWLRKSDIKDARFPAKTFIPVPVTLTSESSEHYKMMEQFLFTEIKRKYGNKMKSKAQNALVKLLRLRQITAGFIPTDKKSWFDKDEPVMMVPLGKEKAEWIIEFAKDNASEQFIVWTAFNFETDRLMKELAAATGKAMAHCTADVVDGRVAINKRKGIFDRFINGDFQILVAKPGCVKYGVSFPGITIAVFASCSYSLEEYEQAVDRIHGIGRGGYESGKKSTFYNLLARTDDGVMTHDSVIQAVLDGKRLMHELPFTIDADWRRRQEEKERAA